jgi:hypothetical protein
MLLAGEDKILLLYTGQCLGNDPIPGYRHAGAMLVKQSVLMLRPAPLTPLPGPRSGCTRMASQMVGMGCAWVK